MAKNNNYLTPDLPISSGMNDASGDLLPPKGNEEPEKPVAKPTVEVQSPDMPADPVDFNSMVGLPPTRTVGKPSTQLKSSILGMEESAASPIAFKLSQPSTEQPMDAAVADFEANKKMEQLERVLDYAMNPEKLAEKMDLADVDDPDAVVRRAVNTAFMRIVTDSDEIPGDPDDIGRQGTRIDTMIRKLGVKDGKYSEDDLFNSLRDSGQKNENFKKTQSEIKKQVRGKVIIDTIKGGTSATRWEDIRKNLESSEGYDPELTDEYREEFLKQEKITKEFVDNFEPELKEMFAAFHSQQKAGKITQLIMPGGFLESVSGIGWLEGMAGRMDEYSETKGTHRTAYEIWNTFKDPEEGDEFLYMLQMVSEAMPDEERDTFFGNVVSSRDVFVEDTARGIGQSLGLTLETLATSDRMMSIDQLAEINERILEHRKQRQFVKKVVAIQRGVYNPIDKLSESGFGQLVEGIAYGTPQLIGYAAMASNPYTAAPLLGHLWDSHYTSLMANLEEGSPHLSFAERDEIASGKAFQGAVIELGSERLGSRLLFGKIPIADKQITAMLGGIKSKALRVGLKVSAGGVEQGLQEVGQNYIDQTLLGVGKLLGEDIDEIIMPSAKENLEAFVAVLPLAIVGIPGAFNIESQIKAYKDATIDELIATGSTPAKAEALKKALDQGEIAAVDAIQEFQQGLEDTPESREAAKRIQSKMEMQLRAREKLEQLGYSMPIFTNTPEGVVVTDGSTGETIGMAKDAASAIKLAKEHTTALDDLRADQIAYLGTMLEGAEAATELDPQSQQELGLGRAFDPSDFVGAAEQYAEQVALKERADGGDGKIAGSVLGSSQTYGIGEDRMTINRLYREAAITDIFHETFHGLRRRALASGAITRTDEIQVLRSLDQIFKGRKTKKGDPMQFIPDGITDEMIMTGKVPAELIPKEFKGDGKRYINTLLDEAISEIAEMEVLRTKKGAGKGRLGVSRGVISRNMTALVKMFPGAAQSFKAFMDAVGARFGLQMARAVAMKGAERRGEFNAEGYEAFLDKVMGVDAQKEHEAGVKQELDRMLGEENVDPDNIPFSIAVTPAMDAEYMKAAESGDMQTAQAMVDEAAKAAGFDSPKVYHGTKGNFTVFDTEGRGKTQDTGAFFTSNLSNAKSYGGKVMEVYIRTDGHEVDANGQNWNALKIWEAFDSSGDSVGEYDTEKQAIKAAGKNGNVIDFSVTLNEEGDFLERDYEDDSEAASTDSLAAEAKRRGWNSLIFTNIIDSRQKSLDFGLSDNAREKSDVYVVFNPNQIKSADPVTRDDQGNIIPLSERFNEKSDDIRMSMAPAGMIDRLEKNVSRRAKGNPEARIGIFNKMLGKLEKIRGLVESRGVAFNFDSFGRPYGQKITTEAEGVLNALAMLDGILQALPPEVRGKIGGYTQLAKLTTNDARMNYLTRKLASVDKHIEKYLQNEYKAMINKRLGSHKIKKSAKGIPTYKKGIADTLTNIQNIAALASISKKSKAEKLDAIQEKMEETENPSEIEALTGEWLEIQAFGSLDSMKATELSDFLVNLKSVEETGKMLKEHQDNMVREEILRLQTITNKDITGGAGRMLSPQSQEAADLRKKWKGVIAGIGKFHRHNLSFEWLINNLSRKNLEVGTLQSETHQNLAVMVHKSTHSEKRENARMMKRYTDFMSKVFGGKKRGKLTKELAKLLDTVKETGVFRTEYEGGAMSVEKTARLSNIEAIINGADAAALGFNAAELESAMEYYKGIVAKKQAAEDAKAAKEGRDPVKVKLPGNRVIKYQSPRPGTNVEQYLSQGQAINLLMLYRQDGLKESMIREGYSKETMEQMEKFLSKESKEIRDWLTKEYAENYHVVNRVFKVQNGVNLPQNKNYSPANRIAQGSEDNNLAIDSRGNKAMSTNPTFTITRTVNFAEVDQKMDALSIYMQHMLQTNHYVAWADSVKKLRGVFSDKDVKQNIKDYAGSSLLQMITEKIEWFADGGNRSARHIWWLDQMRAAHTFSALAYDVFITIKQFTSLPAFAFDMPFKDFGVYLAKFSENPIANIRTMLNTEYVPLRFKEGSERDIVYAMTQSGGAVTRFLQHGMITVRSGDIVPVIIGGWMARQRSYDMSKKNNPNISEADAWEKANIVFEMVTDRAQQASDYKDQSSFSGGGSVEKLFTMYITSLRQYYANVYESFLDAKEGSFFSAEKGKKGSTKEFARRFFIGQIILPLTFQFISDTLKAPFNDDDEEDWAPEDYYRAMLLGPLNGLYIVGDLIEGAASAAVGSKIWDPKNPVMEGAFRAFKTGSKIEKGEFGAAADEILSGIGKTVPSVFTFYDIFRKQTKNFIGKTPDELGDD